MCACQTRALFFGLGPLPAGGPSSAAKGGAIFPTGGWSWASEIENEAHPITRMAHAPCAIFELDGHQRQGMIAPGGPQKSPPPPPAGKKILGLRLWGGLAEAMLLASPGLGWP